jgi:hypothetical protein
MENTTHGRLAFIFADSDLCFSLKITDIPRSWNDNHVVNTTNIHLNRMGNSRQQTGVGAVRWERWAGHQSIRHLYIASEYKKMLAKLNQLHSTTLVEKSACSRVVLEKLTISQFINIFFNFDITHISLPISQGPSNCPYFEPYASDTHLPILSLLFIFQYYFQIYN